MKDAMKVLQSWRYESIGSTVILRRNIPCTPYSTTQNSEEGVCFSMCTAKIQIMEMPESGKHLVCN
jgi:hypothetical protein